MAAHLGEMVIASDEVKRLSSDFRGKATVCGGGGGARSYSRTITSKATIGSSQTVTVGAGGNSGGSGSSDTVVGSLRRKGGRGRRA
jgi:hypothetical protein